MESKELTPGDGADLNLSPDASPITTKNQDISSQSQSTTERNCRYSAGSQSRAEKYLTLKEKREMAVKVAE